MANVFLTPEAYSRLKASKKPGQSFSDVILANIAADVDLSDFLGACKGMMDAKALSGELTRDRKSR